MSFALLALYLIAYPHFGDISFILNLNVTKLVSFPSFHFSDLPN